MTATPGDPATDPQAATLLLDAWGSTLSEHAGADPDVTLRTPPPDGGAGPAAQADGGAAGPAAPLDAPPDLGGDLALAERLGEGGMGVVHAARQRSLDRVVAVKALRPGASSDALVRAFLDEARITARLEHPGVVPIHALGRGPDGRLLLAMKRVEGRTWAELLRSDPPSAGPAALGRHLQVLARVLDALAFAHDRRVLHRDLKPANVMVGAFGQVYVLDWGLARTLDEGGRAASTTPAGTPAYISPEAAGCSEPLGPASDVYLVGAVLHELLTGRPPHRGPSALNVLVAALRNDVLPLRPAFDAPAELVALAERCLATRPAERFPSAVELRAAFEAFLAGDERRRQAEAARAEAAARLGRLPPPGDPAAAVAQYGALLEADALVQRALEGWPGGPPALALRRELDVRLVRCALAAGDVALAASFLARARAAGPVAPELEEAVERRRRELDPATALALSVAARRARLTSGGLALASATLGLALPGAALLAGRWAELHGETLLLFQLLALACFPAAPLHLAWHLAARRLDARARGAWRAAVALGAVALLHLAVTWVVALQATRHTGSWWLTMALLPPLGAQVHALVGLLDARVRALLRG